MGSLYNYNFIKHFDDLEKQNHWDYKNKKDKPIDKIISYPAKMVSDMQGEIISKISEELKIESIFDPFMGSGTILTESVDLDIPEIYGNDINPFSYLIVKVKTTKIEREVLEICFTKLFKKIKENNLESSRFFPKITKWYSDIAISQLSKIINEIEKIEDNDVKDFFKLAFSKLSKEVSNTRNTTFKLHIKSEIVKYNDCFERFEKIVTNQIDLCSKFWERKNYNDLSIDLYNEDLKNLNLRKKFDLIITSPPYGDNKTTVTYGEFSVLQLKWLGEKVYTPYSAIDSASLGGVLCKKEEISNIEIYKISNKVKLIVDKLLSETNSEKARKVLTFMQDFFDTLKNIIKHLNPTKGKLVLTVGNRKVNNNEIPFNRIIDEMIELLGLNKVQEFSRNLPTTKKIAQKTSRLPNGKSVKSMDKEYVLIYSK